MRIRQPNFQHLYSIITNNHQKLRWIVSERVAVNQGGSQTSWSDDDDHPGVK